MERFVRSVGGVMIKTLLLVASVGFSSFLGCSGTDGKDGTPGAPGARGPRGDAGLSGSKGDPGLKGDMGIRGLSGSNADGGPMSVTLPEGGLTAGCLSPCHGFTGIVEQWKTSTHYATFIANLGGDEVATWTGNQACGNCHAIDGIEQRLGGHVNFIAAAGPAHVAEGETNYLNGTAATESTYAGHANVAVVHCTTCHEVDATTDPHRTGKNYTPGSFPLRVPTGATEQARLEKSSAVGTVDGTQAGVYGKGNACIWCHKSRKDVTNYIAATNNITSTHWGPHEGPQSDIYTGKGGYHFSGKSYRSSSHQAFKNGCVDCHMPDVASNGNIGDHSFYPQLATCQQAGCHVTATSFDVIGGQSAMRAGIQELRVALNTAGFLTRDGTNALTATDLKDPTFSLDLTRSATGLTADQAGSLYNYLLLGRGSASGAHNPVYTRELIYDSLFAITGAAPATIPSRP